MGQAGSFPTTQWSQVARAAGGRADGPASQREALETLLRQYLPAFRAHVVHGLRVPADQADDLVQSFVCDRIVAEGLIAGADRSRGRLRTYLLTALDRHVARVRRYEGAAKRRPCVAPASLDDHDPPAASSPTASETFDVAWAKQVVAQAIDQMRKECNSGGRTDIWGVFEARVLAPLLHGAEPTPYPQLADSLRLASTDVAANLAVTGKRMFARCLRAVVHEYLADDADVEQEIADLRQILAGGK